MYMWVYVYIFYVKIIVIIYVLSPIRESRSVSNICICVYTLRKNHYYKDSVLLSRDFPLRNFYRYFTKYRGIMVSLTLELASSEVNNSRTLHDRGTRTKFKSNVTQNRFVGVSHPNKIKSLLTSSFGQSRQTQVTTPLGLDIGRGWGLGHSSRDGGVVVRESRQTKVLQVKQTVGCVSVCRVPVTRSHVLKMFVVCHLCKCPKKKRKEKRFYLGASDILTHKCKSGCTGRTSGLQVPCGTTHKDTNIKLHPGGE